MSGLSAHAGFPGTVQVGRQAVHPDVPGISQDLLLDRRLYEQRRRELQKDTAVFDHVITVKVDGIHE